MLESSLDMSWREVEKRVDQLGTIATIAWMVIQVVSLVIVLLLEMIFKKVLP
jgi:hypothetical protein